MIIQKVVPFVTIEGIGLLRATVKQPNAIIKPKPLNPVKPKPNIVIHNYEADKPKSSVTNFYWSSTNW